MLIETNGFFLVKKINDNFSLPKHLANDKSNLEKIGVYEVITPSILSDYGLIDKFIFDSLMEEINESYDFYVYVDNFSINDVSKFNKEFILVPKSAVLLIEAVSRNEAKD